MEKRWAKWTFGCAAAVGVFLAVLIVIGFLISYGVRRSIRQGLSAQDEALLDSIFDDPVTVPEEWREVYTFPEDLVAAGRQLADAYGSVTDEATEWREHLRKLQAGEALTDEEWARAGKTAEEHAPFLQAVSGLASMDGYELAAFPPYRPGAGMPNFLMVQITARHSCLAAYVRGREGDWDEAFDPCVTVFRLVRRHPASSLINHLIAISCEGMASRCVARLAAECDRPDVLREVLDEMNRLDEEINLDVLDRTLMVHWVSMLRGFALQGYDVDLSSEEPLRYLFRQALDISIEQGGGRQYGHWGRLKDAPIASRAVEEILVRMELPNVNEARTRELVAKAKYDLARLALALRIEELETGERPADVAALVAKYFPPGLSDPFSTTGYRTVEQEGRPYSIGPDGTDESAGITYDGTNGTMSVGDIFLAGREGDR